MIIVWLVNLFTLLKKLISDSAKYPTGKPLEKKSQKATKPMKPFAFRPPNRTVNTTFIHCSASDHAHHDDVRVIREWHLERGFNDVGYHFFIQRNGNIQTGRDIEKTPAAQKGHNTGSIAICLHGLNRFTQPQLDALTYLCTEIDKYLLGVRFRGHCEVSNKTCPNFDYKALLGLSEGGRISV